MKNVLFYIMTLITAIGGFAQKADTIYASENYNTALFFPDRIRQGIVGADNFLFSYNEAQPQHFALVKALPGTASNLLVLTEDGAIYSYVLKYNKGSNLHYRFIAASESIGNVWPSEGSGKDTLKADPVLSEIAKDSLLRREKDMERLSIFYLKSSSGKIKSVTKGGLELKVENLAHYRDQVFLVLSFTNNSRISFEPEYVKVFTQKGNKQRNASFQKVQKVPVFQYRYPEVVLRKEQKRFVLVFSKFTLGKKEKILLEVREKKGNRALKLLFKQ